MKPENLLEQHGFFDTLEPAISLANAVFVGKKYVVRIAQHEHTDHAREAAIALHALTLGIRTAKPLAWAKQYSIFERLNGSSAATYAPNAVWLELLLDLKRFHASPFETSKPESIYWDGAVHLLESIFVSHLSRTELHLAKQILQPHSATNLVFAHGDAWQSNVITNNKQYVGLIDWGNAAWLPLEREIAWLEDDALNLALEQFDLNMPQLWARRLEILLLAGMSGRGTIEAVQRVLEQVVI